MSGQHPPWKVQSFISAVVHWSSFITFPERLYHPPSVHRVPQCSHSPEELGIKSSLLFIYSLSPNHQTAADWGYDANLKYRDSKLVSSCHLSNQITSPLKKNWHITAALLFVPKSSNLHSYCRDSVNGARQIKKKRKKKEKSFLHIISKSNRSATHGLWKILFDVSALLTTFPCCLGLWKQLKPEKTHGICPHFLLYFLNRMAGESELRLRLCRKSMDPTLIISE